MGEKTGNTRVVNGETEYEWLQDYSDVPEDNIEWRNAKGQVTQQAKGIQKNHLTPERGRQLALAQQEEYRREAREGMMRAVDEGRLINTRSSPEAFGYLVQRQAEIADSLDQGMASVKSFQNVERAIGLDERQQAVAAAAIQVNINISEKATEGFDADVEFLEAEFSEE